MSKELIDKIKFRKELLRGRIYFEDLTSCSYKQLYGDGSYIYITHEVNYDIFKVIEADKNGITACETIVQFNQQSGVHHVVGRKTADTLTRTIMSLKTIGDICNRMIEYENKNWTKL